MLHTADDIIVPQPQHHQLHRILLWENTERLRKTRPEQRGVRRLEVLLAAWSRLQPVILHVNKPFKGRSTTVAQHGSLKIQSKSIKTRCHLHAFALARSIPALRPLLPVLSLHIAQPRLQLQPLRIRAQVLRAGQAPQQ